VNPSTSLARAVVDGLLAAGVRHVVLAPGSRSAPLAYELQAADRAGRLTLHVRVDERAAGFLALGLAKLARVPAAVVTTSGTAVANLHPAVLEAHHGLVPLLVLSADRPRGLRGIGANQTTTQPGIFGDVTRLDAELDVSRGDAAVWAALVQSAARAARGGRTTSRAAAAPAGPAHLNIALGEPLVPDLSDPPRDGWPSAAGTSADEGEGGGPAMLRLPDRTLVVIGDLPEPDQARRVAAWAGELGWPAVAEPFGEQPLGRSVIPHGSLLLGTSWFEAHRPEHLVVAGRVTLSRSVRRALTDDPSRVTYLGAGPRWLGPSFEAARTVDLDGALLGTLRWAGSRRAAWSTGWRAAGAAVGAVLGETLSWGSGPAVARELVGALPAGSSLVVGSSNPVRDLELAVDWATASPVRVVANRGLAGIDGVVSTAAGIALAGTAPTYALVGDLTFLHDANAMLVGPDEPRPHLTVVVVNDDGGGIFGTLEPGEPGRSGDFERVFGTPTGARIADLARAFGIRYARAESAAELAAAVAMPPQGLSVIEVPVERGGHRPLRERLRAVAEEATARLVDPPEPGPGRPDRDYPERGTRR
jgi:2-succinyl-5-enolpyruvyl-6-hydroxy-3-cyclohexene-1-carboxylate synthase